MPFLRPRRPWRALALLLMVGFGLAGACTVPTYGFADGTGGAGALANPAACTQDFDCRDLASLPVCDPDVGRCVECLPSSTGSDGCGEGLYCDATKHCVVGCHSSADCANGLSCDGASARCSGCVSDADCGPGTACLSGVCEPSCSDSSTCPSGWQCCSGACVNPLTDARHCQNCGGDCGSGECVDGRCASPLCPTNFAECDGSLQTRCETDLSTNPNHCGRCGNACTTGVCSGGRCTTLDCPSGFADCNQRIEDGCEASLSSVDDCQACGVVCSSVNGVPACTAQGCTITCNAGFADCDGRLVTGCESDVRSSDAHCGDCDTHCQNAHGSTQCSAGSCVPSCATGFADCDGDPSNGCETDISGSPDNCGACGRVCDPAHATGRCVAGVCGVASCNSGHEDCNADPSDGCEADLTSPQSCGRCDNHCSSNGGSAVCSDGSCGIVCDPGRADCANGVADGCEADLTSSVMNCGSCGRVCSVAGGTPACSAGACGISACAGTLADCNGGSDGCETDLSNDPNNCGDCGHVCYYPNGIGRCVNKQCVFDSCQTGWADCTSAPGCETQLGTPANCSACNDLCSNAHGSTTCSNGLCAPTCSTGWGSCDGDPKNGCETNLLTTSNCGSCGSACSFPNAGASCSTGSCSMGSCAPGFADCSAAAGCETALGTVSNCSGCGSGCSNLHGSTSCTGSPGSYACTPSCAQGYLSCDADASNGCETDVTTSTHCGTCTTSCAAAAPYCVSGACVHPVVNAATGSSLSGSSAQLNITHALQTGAGDDRIVVVAVAGDGNSATGAAVTGVTYNTVPLTLGHSIWSGNRAWIGLFYAKDSELPPAPGNYVVRITGSELGKVANVIELRGIDQANPILTLGGSTGGNCTSDPPSDAITTSVSNALILSAVATFGSELGTPNSGQTSSYTGTDGSVGFKDGYLGPVSAGTRTLAWNMTSCNASAHALMALRPASP